MKYRELVEIPKPLETVKQVRDSATPDKARGDVETFVISDRMAKQLEEIVVPQLRFDAPADNRGLFVVGTYGTGKTHLMSVIAAICEFDGVVDALPRGDVRKTMSVLSSQFEVVRFDIGASTMSLRDIVCAELTNGLAARGVSYVFPPISQVTNTKDHLVDMMAALEAKYPDKGLLFVLDEMLDYLRGRRDAELIQDLAFLREIGEVCKNTRFRFIGGLQESLFDHPRFAGVADAIRRVKDRFAQVRIAREDVAYVVRERLLPKRADQKIRIREHLSQFTSLFDGLAERLDEFVDLYPIHPAYLTTFEQLTLVEKREVLRTVETEMARLADVDVPAEAPGVVCLDSYRARLEDDPGARTVPEVQEVLDKSQVVRAKLQTALPETEYVDTAMRIVDALSIHRLTTDDVRARIGMTSEELRDQLFLLPPGLPRRDAIFLRTTVEAILKKMLVAVSGQFLSRNEDNGQYYLDVDKDIDYDQLIEQRAEDLDLDRLDSAYYVSIEETLGIRDDPYVAGYRIWAYPLTWPEKHSARSGYLFMGAPSERSTAQPPRDFYVYFLQPFETLAFIDEERSDEIFLRLDAPDHAFTAALRTFAGARELATESTADRRAIYDEKARAAQRKMVTWLKANMHEAMGVTYRGERRTLGEWLALARGERDSVAEQLRTVCSHVLSAHFEQRFPDYPVFGVEITPSNRADAVQSVLRHLADPARATTASRKVLASLDLLVPGEDAVRGNGRFAEALSATLAAANGNVVNRAELLVERDRGVRTWAPWHLEPEWLVVVAAALVHLGKAEIGYPGQKIDAITLDRLVTTSAEELVQFSHLSPPASLPTAKLKRAAEIVGLPPGAVPMSGATTDLVSQLGTKAVDMQQQVLDAQRVLAEGLDFWGADVLELKEERRAHVAALAQLADDLRARNSVGRLNKFSLDDELLDRAKAGKTELERLSTLQKARARLEPHASYLREAVASFAGTGLADDTVELRQRMLEALKEGMIDVQRIAELTGDAEELRDRFIKAAGEYFRHAYLDRAGEQAKQRLLASPEWSALGKLASITLLQGGQFSALRADLTEARTVMHIDEAALRSSVILDGRSPGPVEGPSAHARLDQIERRSAELLEGWTATLADNLGDPELEEQIDMLDPAAQSSIRRLIDTRTLPDPVTDELVAAVDQVFVRFDIRRVDRTAMLERLFPGDAAAAPEELICRFREFVDETAAGAAPDRVRIVPAPTKSGAT